MKLTFKNKSEYARVHTIEQREGINSSYFRIVVELGSGTKASNIIEASAFTTALEGKKLDIGDFVKVTTESNSDGFLNISTLETL